MVKLKNENNANAGVANFNGYKIYYETTPISLPENAAVKIKAKAYDPNNSKLNNHIWLFFLFFGNLL